MATSARIEAAEAEERAREAREAEQRDVERAAQPLLERQQPEHLARVRVRVRVGVRVGVRVRVCQQPEHRHVARDEGDRHEVAAEELDRGAGRGVEHLVRVRVRVSGQGEGEGKGKG